jgi:hypothetical protein
VEPGITLLSVLLLIELVIAFLSVLLLAELDIAFLSGLLLIELGIAFLSGLLLVKPVINGLTRVGWIRLLGVIIVGGCGDLTGIGLLS